MTALACSFWIAEFLLEVFAAYFSYRRRIVPLGIFLGFRALADVACIAVSFSLGGESYAWAWYGQRLTQLVLLAVLVMYFSARLLRSDRYTMRFYMFMAGVFAFGAIAFFHGHPLTTPAIMHFFAGAYAIVGTFLCAALICGRSARPWFAMANATLVMAVSNGALSAMQANHWHVTAYYPFGEIAALLLWCVALLQKEESAQEIRLPVTSVRTPVFGWVDKSGEGQIN